MRAAMKWVVILCCFGYVPLLLHPAALVSWLEATCGEDLAAKPMEKAQRIRRKLKPQRKRRPEIGVRNRHIIYYFKMISTVPTAESSPTLPQPQSSRCQTDQRELVALRCVLEGPLSQNVAAARLRPLPVV